MVLSVATFLNHIFSFTFLLFLGLVELLCLFGFFINCFVLNILFIYVLVFNLILWYLC